MKMQIIDPTDGRRPGGSQHPDPNTALGHITDLTQTLKYTGHTRTYVHPVRGKDSTLLSLLQVQRQPHRDVERQPGVEGPQIPLRTHSTPGMKPLAGIDSLLCRASLTPIK